MIAMATVSGKQQFTLGDFIDALARFPADEEVKFDFVHVAPTSFHSYRGFYEDIALGHDADAPYPTVAVLLEKARAVVGGRFEGYKGGTYTMSRDSTLWVANHNETGSTAVVGIEQHLYVTVMTDLIDA